ncbi:MAG: DUF294 nucleotidyltransferase-like domain-containing protein [Actinomycetota bacterium]|nr:DUF294 nucleotidyltransferase-like domain-containing protein [Actinomycetota bacterium]
MELLDQLAQPLRIVAGLRSLSRLEVLDDYHEECVAAVERLLGDEPPADAPSDGLRDGQAGRLPEDGADVLAVTQALAGVNDALTRRLLELAEAELGPPPCAYAWLALGSHGRGEQVLSSDQDSALAFASDGWAAGEYFPRLAAPVVDGLARAGLPLCSGGYMATEWCRPLEEFRAMFAGWVDRPEPEALVRAEVFLDVRPVHGELAVDVLDRILVGGGSRGPFRAQLARAAVTFRPPLSVFGRLRSRHALDVKGAGTAAIVLIARLYALVGGSSARTTLSRLEAAADAGALHARDAADLADAYRLLTRLRLRAQVEQVRRGERAGNVVSLDTLPPGERDHLVRALREVRDVQDYTASRFATFSVS